MTGETCQRGLDWSGAGMRTKDVHHEVRPFERAFGSEPARVPEADGELDCWRALRTGCCFIRPI